MPAPGWYVPGVPPFTVNSGGEPMKIACVLDRMFEDSEFQEPYHAFREAGHQVDVIGLEAGKELQGKKGKVTVRSDTSFAEVRADDYDALMIPGGDSPD